MKTEYQLAVEKIAKENAVKMTATKDMLLGAVIVNVRENTRNEGFGWSEGITIELSNNIQIVFRHEDYEGGKCEIIKDNKITRF